MRQESKPFQEPGNARSRQRISSVLLVVGLRDLDHDAELSRLFQEAGGNLAAFAALIDAEADRLFATPSPGRMVTRGARLARRHRAGALKTASIMLTRM